MGSGTYSTNSFGDFDHTVRANNLKARVDNGISADYSNASRHEIFSRKSINDAMSPYEVDTRESRDSDEHPNSLAVVIALDITGSMGSIPHFLIKEGLPLIMGNLIQRGIKDPQVLFTAVGDHTCDRAPLQVGQFESSDELLDHWLENVYLEGGGGGNDGESYFLSWYFAGKHTAIDCHEKRGQKGFLFTIGDEKNLINTPRGSMETIMGKNQYDLTTDTITFLEKAREKYHVFHLHIREGANGNRIDVIDGWKQIMGESLIVVDHKEDIAKIIPEKIISLVGVSSEPAKQDDVKPEPKREEVIL